MKLLTKTLPAMMALGVLVTGPAIGEVTDRAFQLGQVDDTPTAERMMTAGAVEDGLDKVMLDRGAEIMKKGIELRLNDVKNHPHINVK